MKRVALFCGHYGSGKTNLAINYALHLRSLGKDVTIADLDIVNPYFRTKDSEDELVGAGVKFIALQFANSNVDLPALPSAAYAIIQDKSRMAVLDIGGDDRGAYALGRYVPALLEEDNYDMFFVANFFRPLTQNAADALEVMREIEGACGLRFTGIINNSNLGRETTVEDVKATFGIAEELSAVSGLPVVGTTIEESLWEEGFIPVHLQKRPVD